MIVFKGKVYDWLKYTAMIVLPGLAGFVITFFNIWDIGYADQIAASITAVNAFLGILLGLSNRTYNNDQSNFDGYLSMTGRDPDTGIPDLALTVTRDPSEILANSNGVARLRVTDPPPQHRAG